MVIGAIIICSIRIVAVHTIIVVDRAFHNVEDLAPLLQKSPLLLLNRYSILFLWTTDSLLCYHAFLPEPCEFIVSLGDCNIVLGIFGISLCNAPLVHSLDGLFHHSFCSHCKPPPLSLRRGPFCRYKPAQQKEVGGQANGHSMATASLRVICSVLHPRINCIATSSEQKDSSSLTKYKTWRVSSTKLSRLTAIEDGSKEALGMKTLVIDSQEQIEA